MLTIQHICTVIDDLATKAEARDGRAISTLAHLRFIAKAAEQAIKRVDPIALEEAESQPKNFFLDGINWTKKEGSRKLDYSAVPAIIHLKEEIEVEQQKADNATRALESMRGVMHEDGGVYTKDGEYIGHPAKVSFTKPSLAMGK